MTHTEPPPTADDTEVLDAAWLAAPSHRSRVRVGMLAALAVLLVFLGGVEVQKHFGASDSTSAAGGRPAGISFPGGGSFPTGGFGRSTSSGNNTTSGSQNNSSSGTSTPAVIGKLTRIHGHTWTVKDLGGTTHTVKVTGKTTVTRPLDRATGPIRPGTNLTVAGRAHGDTVVATAVTLR